MTRRRKIVAISMVLIVLLAAYIGRSFTFESIFM